MAQRQLRSNRRTAIGCGLAFMAAPLISCVHRTPVLGFSLSFFNRGQRPLTNLRFDFDNKRGPMNGYLGPGGGGSHMGFMPGDRKDGIPQSVEVEWILHSKEYSAWSNSTPNSEIYSKENQAIYEKLWAATPRYIKRVDLTTILTPRHRGHSACRSRKYPTENDHHLQGRQGGHHGRALQMALIRRIRRTFNKGYICRKINVSPSTTILVQIPQDRRATAMNTLVRASRCQKPKKIRRQCTVALSPREGTAGHGR